MTFARIARGSSVFIDAKTRVYYAVADPRYGAACKQLLERIARQEVDGFTSAHALADIAHRVMTLEAIDRFGWLAKGIAHRLRQNPAEVQKLRPRARITWSWVVGRISNPSVESRTDWKSVLRNLHNLFLRGP